MKLMRDQKRPSVYYSEVLNGLSDQEWDELKLPPVTSICHSSNKQLVNLDVPTYYPIKFSQGKSRIEPEMSRQQPRLQAPPPQPGNKQVNLPHGNVTFKPTPVFNVCSMGAAVANGSGKQQSRQQAQLHQPFLERLALLKVLYYQV